MDFLSDDAMLTTVEQEQQGTGYSLPTRGSRYGAMRQLENATQILRPFKDDDGDVVIGQELGSDGFKTKTVKRSDGSIDTIREMETPPEKALAEMQFGKSEEIDIPEFDKDFIQKLADAEVGANPSGVGGAVTDADAAFLKNVVDVTDPTNKGSGTPMVVASASSPFGAPPVAAAKAPQAGVEPDAKAKVPEAKASDPAIS